MSNHYYLPVETPEGNWVKGVQWLQATFANRFNRLGDERAHLFQGRYKSLLVEDGPTLGQPLLGCPKVPSRTAHSHF